APPAATPKPSENIEVWWPAPNASISGTQPFKAIMPHRTLDQYALFWRVDGGPKERLYNYQTEYPHKERPVNVTLWQPGPHTIEFLAYDKAGKMIGIKQVRVTVFH
ncbi:MAG TPA: hypothetical protein VK983_04750, partial [Candidatus Limnocylindrales bacterium]|nr:hypothetical protein [Candidatus Limnocylindrales bacterium]